MEYKWRARSFNGVHWNTRECTEKIPAISKMNNYKFMLADKTKVWRAYKVGKGKIINTAKPSVGKLQLERANRGRFCIFSMFSN
jgi:hypothetical protein